MQDRARGNEHFDDQPIAFTREDKRKLTKLYVDVFEGENMDNPSITLRLDRVERAAESVKRLTWAIILASIAAVGDIVVHSLK